MHTCAGLILEPRHDSLRFPWHKTERESVGDIATWQPLSWVVSYVLCRLPHHWSSLFTYPCLVSSWAEDGLGSIPTCHHSCPFTLQAFFLIHLLCLHLAKMDFQSKKGKMREFIFKCIFTCAARKEKVLMNEEGGDNGCDQVSGSTRVYLCICVFVYLCICVFVYLSICLFVYL